MTLYSADADYLARIYESQKDDAWVEAFSRVQPDVASILALWSDQGLTSPAEQAADVMLAREILSPKELFRGTIADSLRDSAIETIGARAAHLAAMPLAILPTRDFNACAIRTPTNGAIIVINSGVFLTLPWFVQCFLAYFTYQTVGSLSRDFPQRDFAETLARLAKFNVTGDPEWLLPMRGILTAHYSPEDERFINSVAAIGQQFIVIHEFAHVMLSHLDSDNTFKLSFPGGLDLEAYSRSQAQEFDADRFAYATLSRLVHADSRVTFALCVGIVFKLIELCERFSEPQRPVTHRFHPPAAERWAVIRGMANVDEEPDSWAAQLDTAFHAFVFA